MLVTLPTRNEHDVQACASMLRDHLDMSPAAAAILATLLCDEDTDPRAHEAGDRRYRECFNAPSRNDMIMHVADALLGTCGVQGWAHPYEYTRGVSYCNTGDSYAHTLILVDDDWLIGGWADAHEAYPSDEVEVW